MNSLVYIWNTFDIYSLDFDHGMMYSGTVHCISCKWEIIGAMYVYNWICWSDATQRKLFVGLSFSESKICYRYLLFWSAFIITTCSGRYIQKIFLHFYTNIVYNKASIFWVVLESRDDLSVKPTKLKYVWSFSLLIYLMIQALIFLFIMKRQAMWV